MEGSCWKDGRSGSGVVAASPQLHMLQKVEWGAVGVFQAWVV